MVAVGSTATVSYAITTTKSASGTIDAWLDGKVCVTNTGSADTQGLAISDQLTEPPSKSVLSTVAVDLSAMPVLAAGASSCYPFRVSVPAASRTAGATYKDSAQVTITNDSGHLGGPAGPTPSTSAALPSSPTVVDNSITVVDNSTGQAFNFGTSGTENYVEGFSCNAAAGPQTMVENNTATIASTGQSSSAQATIHCGAPTTLTTTLSKATIGQGTSVSDQASISGAAATAGGTIKYYVYSDATCTTQVADATPVANTVVNAVAPASRSVELDNTGSYWWVAVYSGDPNANTLGSSSDCAAEPLTVQPNDFSIAADPSSVSVAQGASATSTISTAVLSGSAGTIAMSVSGVPSGASASLDQTSVTAGDSATLTVDTGTAAPGTYTLTVTGSEGGTTHSVQLTLTVKSLDDFSLSASPSTVSLSQGASGTSTILTAVTSGAAEAVALAVTGAPAGASASLSPTSVTAGQTSTLTINTGTAAAGTYTLIVTGSEASGAAHSAAIALTITSQPANDFAISASPGSVTAPQGQAASSTISTVVTTGSAETIDLAVSGLPSGASASLSPTSVTAGQASALTINAGTAAAGTYTLIVTGSAASASHSAPITLIITSSQGGSGITNGGFETGTLSGWTSSGAVETIVSSGCHGGTYCARLGSSSPTDGDSTITQTFTAPAGTTGLSLWYEETCPDTVTYDWALATLTDNTAGTTATVIAKTCTTNAWTNETASVTAGHSYTLALTSHDDNYSADPTFTLFDDVTLTSSAPPPTGITNGGFEARSLTGWTSSGASETIVTSGCHGGTACAMLGKTTPTNGDSSISQTFTVPSGKSQLSLWYKETCPDTVTYDWATVTLKDNSTGATTTVLSKTCAVNAWTNLTAAVTAGTSYTLTLTSHDDNYSADPTYTLFDDVTLN